MSPRHALTDEQWNRIKGLLPGQVGDPGQSGRDNRLFVDAVLFITKTVLSDRENRACLGETCRNVLGIGIRLGVGLIAGVKWGFGSMS